MTEVPLGRHADHGRASGSTWAVYSDSQDAASDLPELCREPGPGAKSNKTVRAALGYSLRSLAFRAETAHGYFPRAESRECRPSGNQLGEDIMRKLLAVGGAALALWAMAASADEVTGTISNIDLNRNTFVVDGKTFTASPSNTVGAKLSELKEGDKVRVDTADMTATKEPYNAMSLKKVE
jgi:hypothetical protein